MQTGTRIALDVRVPLVEALDGGHNRWHPEIPPVLRVTPGEVVVIDTRDGLDGQITWESTDEDVRTMDMRRGHPLSGPIFIEGAKAGDLLEVETLEITPDTFGFTIIVPGFGLLADRFDKPYVVKWRIENNVATSAELPGVRIVGAPFMGVMGVAPSAERMRGFLQREEKLAQTGAIVLLPEPGSAIPADGVVAAEGLRTVPPRETGGNMDIKQLRVGSSLLLPVDVDGALFSVGDLHFAQGDGESCGVAIEMHGQVTLRFGVRKASTLRWRPRYPAFEFAEPPGDAKIERRHMVTTGLPIASDGTVGDLDVRLAARAALEEMVAYLTDERGYSANQAYILVSVAADLRISSIVNVPNPVVSAVLPLSIFDDDAS
jgi:formamidase